MWENWLVQVWLNDNWWLRCWCSSSIHSKVQYVSHIEGHSSVNRGIAGNQLFLYLTLCFSSGILCFLTVRKNSIEVKNTPQVFNKFLILFDLKGGSSSKTSIAEFSHSFFNFIVFTCFSSSSRWYWLIVIWTFWIRQSWNRLLIVNN